MTQHSRIDSSGGVSIISRESMVPLNGAESITTPPDVHRSPISHPRTFSQGSEGLMLIRPLEPAVESNAQPDYRRESVQSAGSPTTPRQAVFPLRVTNADDIIEGGSSQGQIEQHSSSKRAQLNSTQSPIIIHVDGGRIEEGSGTLPPPPRDAPPAYTKMG